MGFGTHPHDNMEIITIIHEGSLEHKDSMDNGSVIRKGEIQVMSAGSGVTHSEFNPSDDDPVSLFQIWLFPNKQNVKPRYDQAGFDQAELKNQWRTIVSPDGSEQSMWIHQDAWLSMGSFDPDQTIDYPLRTEDHGIFLMVIEGDVEVDEYDLGKRDAAGFTDLDKPLSIEIKKQSKLLLMEVPMNK